MRSMFSNRYDNKRTEFYERYEAARALHPNLPQYERPVEPDHQDILDKSTQRRYKSYMHLKKETSEKFLSEDWLASDKLEIVVRRTIEERNYVNNGLMPKFDPTAATHEFSHNGRSRKRGRRPNAATVSRLISDFAQQVGGMAYEEEGQVEDSQSQVKESQGQVKENQRQVKENQSQVKESQSLAKENQSRAKESQSQLKENQRQVKQSQGQVKENQSQAQESQIQDKKSQSQVKESQSQVKENQSQVQESQIQVKKSQIPVKKSQIPVKKNQIPVKKNQIQVKNNKSQVQESDILNSGNSDMMFKLIEISDEDNSEPSTKIQKLQLPKKADRVRKKIQNPLDDYSKEMEENIPLKQHRIFGCPVEWCQENFDLRRSLSKHQRETGHHSWSHKCEKCGKIFRTEGFKRLHARGTCALNL